MYLYSICSNTCLVGEDFTAVPQTRICFMNNSRTSEEFTVIILGASANIPEFDEVFSVRIDLLPEAVSTPESAATVTIIDSK